MIALQKRPDQSGLVVFAVRSYIIIQNNSPQLDFKIFIINIKVNRDYKDCY